MALITVVVLLLTVAARGVLGTVQLLNLTASQVPGITTTCLQVLNQAVACDAIILDVSRANIRSEMFYPDDTLNKLCVSTCAAGLKTWFTRVNGACASQLITMPNGYRQMPLVYAESFFELYNATCLTDPSGKLCNAVARSAGAINPADQMPTATQTSNWMCNSCYVSLKSTLVAMPLASNTDLRYFYGNITSSCKISNMAVTTAPKTTWVVTPTAITTGATTTTSAAAGGCAGTKYTIKSGDTCQTISKSQKISTVNLLIANQKAGFCYNFPTTGTLCIPTSSQCTPYTILSSDSCESIADTLKTSWTRLVSWNPELGANCQNIDQYVGYVICGSNPGGGWMDPSPPVSTTSTPTTTSIDTRPWTPFASMSSVTTSSTIAGNLTTPTAMPMANGTINDCAIYLDPPVLLNVTAGTNSTKCSDVAAAYGVTVGNLQEWNPSLGNSSSCSLSVRSRYCVLRFLDAALNVTSACIQREVAAPGYDCDQFAGSWGIEKEQFVAWNPAVGPGCANYKLGAQYCVAVYGFRQPGIVANCNKFAMPNTTSWINRPCEIMETTFGLQHARFVAWNPAVKDNCAGIYPLYEYCVSIPNYKPTYTTPATQPPPTGRPTVVPTEGFSSQKPPPS